MLAQKQVVGKPIRPNHRSKRDYGFAAEEDDEYPEEYPEDYADDIPPDDEDHAYDYGYAADSASVEKDADYQEDTSEYHTIPPEGLLDVHGYWWTSSEAHLAEYDEQFPEEDEEYQEVLVTYVQAKEALRNDRAAR